MSDDITLTEAEARAGIVRCDACPVLCRIRPGRAGACDRYANEAGKLVRVDPLVLLAKPELKLAQVASPHVPDRKKFRVMVPPALVISGPSVLNREIR